MRAHLTNFTISKRSDKLFLKKEIRKQNKPNPLHQIPKKKHSINLPKISTRFEYGKDQKTKKLTQKYIEIAKYRHNTTYTDRIRFETETIVAYKKC